MTVLRKHRYSRGVNVICHNYQRVFYSSTSSQRQIQTFPLILTLAITRCKFRKIEHVSQYLPRLFDQLNLRGGWILNPTNVNKNPTNVKKKCQGSFREPSQDVKIFNMF